MKLIIVRHAEAEHNVQSLMVSHGPSRLTEKGKDQVQLVAARLGDEHIDMAISSDSERALHTAQGILKFHPTVTLAINPLLRERHMGGLEGKTKEEFIADQKSSGLQWYEHKPVGGESMLETKTRAASFFEELKKRYLGKTVLIVSHGGFIRAFLGHLLKHEFGVDNVGRIGHTAVTIIEIDDRGQHLVRSINDTTHLGDEALNDSAQII